MKLNKFDVARRQFNTALQLWFTGGDPVSIHTLAVAAFDVLTQVAKSRGAPFLTLDEMAKKTATAFSVDAKDVLRDLRAWPNFFKHADKDPEAETEFEPECSSAFLAGCLVHLMAISESINEIEALFKVRLALERPEQYRSAPLEKLTPGHRELWSKLTRVEFWNLNKGNISAEVLEEAFQRSSPANRPKIMVVRVRDQDERS